VPITSEFAPSRRAAHPARGRRWLRLALVASVALGAVLAFTGCTDAKSPSTPRVVFDTDADFDDIVALTLLLSEGVRIDGIAVERSGWGLPNRGARHIGQALKAIGHDCIPIIQGGARITEHVPIDLSRFRTLQLQINGAIEAALGDTPACPFSDAEDPIAQFGGSSRDTLIIATGPLTSVARYVSNHPRHVAQLIFMGQTPGTGNALKFPSNNQLDAVAAQRVFASQVPITLVDYAFVAQTALAVDVVSGLAKPERPTAALFSSLVEGIVRIEHGGAGLYLWDVVAASVFLDSDIVETEARADLSIDMTGTGAEYARVIADVGTKDRVPTVARKGAFRAFVLKAMNR
jgi:inosine-uridine nucleoside N-ribohydrolase